MPKQDMLFSKSPRLGRESPSQNLHEMDPAAPKRGAAGRAFAGRGRPGSAPGGKKSNNQDGDQSTAMTAESYIQIAMTVSEDRVEVSGVLTKKNFLLKPDARNTGQARKEASAVST